MNLKLCDFCKSIIRDEDDVLISVVITYDSPEAAISYTPGVPQGKAQIVLDMCQDCGEKKKILEVNENLLPNRGALTEKEIRELIRE